MCSNYSNNIRYCKGVGNRKGFMKRWMLFMMGLVLFLMACLPPDMLRDLTPAQAVCFCAAVILLTLGFAKE